MGSSLSHQEELFLRRDWAELLQDAVTADVEALAATPADSTADLGEESHTPHKPSISPSPSPSLSQRTPKPKRTDEFRLSCQEWQAFLAVLEQKDRGDANAAPSDIVARLTTAQQHVPVVSLLVHVCVWWRGALSTASLGDRVEQLVKLVEDLQHGHDNSAHETPEPEGVAAPAAAPSTSRRARVARFVQKKVVDRAKHRLGGDGAATSHTRAEMEGFFLDTFADMTCLVQHLLTQATKATVTAGDSAASATSYSSGAFSHAKDIFDLYDEKIRDASVLQQRPVLAVVMVITLAVFASKIESHPEYAVRSVRHLEALEAMMLAKGGSHASTRSTEKTTSTATASLAAMWPLVGELEVALVHRQHEADALRCLSADGSALMGTLRDMRAKREALRREAKDRTASRTTTVTPSERWAAGQSQYIGQRPIWTQLRSHFLSAGVFDADKPTVLVFFGPSGYGKSELAKRVASILHDCPMSELEAAGKMVYIHMPSFCTKDSIYSLVDPPAAHVGSGILLSALQKHPDAVVVLDEFEKSTAESINNLWLSAFQKSGMLRSLKEASRSVSTVRTTFILTCNIAAESIAAREDVYLRASPADQEKLRSLYVTQCKDTCRASMGDPFVNRVDAFLPFMPYTRAERHQFVCLLLERLLTSQAEKGRHLYATPGFVEAMVDKLRTFHAATLEEVVRAQVVHMVQVGWSSAVLTVERHIGGVVTVLLPTTRDAAVPERQEGVTRGDDEADNQTLCLEAWDSLPGGAMVLQHWEPKAAASSSTIASPSRGAAAPPTVTAGTTDVLHAVTAASPPPPQLPQCSPDSPLLEKEYERAYTTEKERILELETALEKTKELLKQRDLEIVTLKDKILLLQKALAVVVLALLACLCFMALVIGLKLTALFALATVGVGVFLVGIPLALVLEAVRALFRALGPFKAGMLVLLILVWLARASSFSVSCS